VIGDGKTPCERRMVEALLEPILDSLVKAEAKQAMRVEGVVSTRNVEPVFETFFRRRGRDCVDHSLRSIDSNRVFARKMAGVVTGLFVGRGRRRIQLEGPPRELDVSAVGKASTRCLKATLADVTPRADDIGPDIDFHRDFNIPFIEGQGLEGC
jgi:hypothetical protein